jgi:beta-lactam-binding protein with PASTA domain
MTRIEEPAIALGTAVGGVVVGALIPALIGKKFAHPQEYQEVARVTVRYTLAAPPTLKGTIVSVSPANGTTMASGTTFSISVTIRNDSTVKVNAYPWFRGVGVKTGTEYFRATVAVETIDPGASKTFTLPDRTMPNEDLDVTIVAYFAAA